MPISTPTCMICFLPLRIYLFQIVRLSGIIRYCPFVSDFFSEHRVFKVRPLCSACQLLPPFDGRIIFHCMAFRMIFIAQETMALGH